MAVSAAAKEVAKKVCAANGHKLASLEVSQAYDPPSKIVLTKFELRCTQCTLTADQIYNLRDRGGPAKKTKGAVDEVTGE